MSNCELLKRLLKYSVLQMDVYKTSLNSLIVVLVYLKNLATVSEFLYFIVLDGNSIVNIYYQFVDQTRAKIFRPVSF